MATDDFFRARLDQMINLRHPLAVLAGRMPRSQIEAALAPVFARKNRSGQVLPGNDMFRTTLENVGAGISVAGRPRLPIPLMAALLYLKHAFNLGDEELVTRWSEMWSGNTSVVRTNTRRQCLAMPPGLAASAPPSAKPGWKSCSRQPSILPCNARLYVQRSSSASSSIRPFRRKPSPIRSIAACWRSPGPRLYRPRSASVLP